MCGDCTKTPIRGLSITLWCGCGGTSKKIHRVRSICRRCGELDIGWWRSRSRIGTSRRRQSLVVGKIERLELPTLPRNCKEASPSFSNTMGQVCCQLQNQARATEAPGMEIKLLIVGLVAR